VNPASQVDIATMKAIYIERFTRFIEWPESMQDELFRIQVVGDKKLSQAFEKVFNEIDIKGKSVLIYCKSDYYDLDFNPHVVYVAEKKNLNDILSSIDNGPVLVVSEIKDGARKGAMINMFLKDNKLRFEINEKAMYNSPLYVSYRLKKAASRIIASQ
jgi:hypothetical protein